MKCPHPELLRVLAAAAESRNFYEAARLAGLSQPAVSMKLKQLQAQVPLPIFSLEGKRKVLTHYGRALYSMAREQREKMDRDFELLNRRYASARDLTLRIGCRQEVFNRVAPKLAFGGRIEHVSLSSHESILALQNHAIDIAVASELPDSAELMAKEVLRSESRLVVHRRWLKGKRLSMGLARDPEFLAGTPCILYQGNGHLLRDWVSHLRLSVAQLRPILVVGDWRGIQENVDAGLGYAIVPSYVEPRSKSVDCLALPHEVLRAYVYFAVFHKDLRQVGPFKRMLSAL
jgi:DNA-binding transcriptional LysR family regulator